MSIKGCLFVKIGNFTKFINLKVHKMINFEDCQKKHLL